jgi:hypothetical protein
MATRDTARTKRHARRPQRGGPQGPPRGGARAAKHNPTDVEGYDELTARNKAIRELMDARDHVRGCPVQEGRELGRVEGYDGRRRRTRRPATTA